MHKPLTNRMGIPALWLMKTEPKIFWDFCQALLGDERLGLLNTREFKLAEYALQLPPGSLTSDDVPLPADFLRLRLAMPDEAIAPDFFYYDAYMFASRCLMEALAQPKDVVQFVPVELASGSPQARAQEYHLMRVLPRQPAMDLARSECSVDEFTSPLTGQLVRMAMHISKFVLLDTLQPRTEIFRVDEAPSRILASDGIAQRVLLAGCTGMEFADPANRWSGMRVERYRTVNGIAERRVGFLD